MTILLILAKYGIKIVFLGFLGIVIGLNLSSQDQERAKQYAKNNQLLYAGTADLYNNNEVERIASKALAAQWQHKKNIQEPGYYKYLETLLKNTRYLHLIIFQKYLRKVLPMQKVREQVFLKANCHQKLVKLSEVSLKEIQREN